MACDNKGGASQTYTAPGLGTVGKVESVLDDSAIYLRPKRLPEPIPCDETHRDRTDIADLNFPLKIF